MGATLDFYILCNAEMNLSAFATELKKGGYCNVEINRISILDISGDSDNQNVISLQDISAYLQKGVTIEVELEIEHFLAAGVYIEKTNCNDFIYNFWVDTESYSALDDTITTQNRCYYNLFYEILSRLIKTGVIVSYKLIAIGIEAELEYSDSLERILESSYNINAWIIHNQFEWNKKIKGYVMKSTDISNSFLFEKENVTN